MLDRLELVVDLTIAVAFVIIGVRFWTHRRLAQLKASSVAPLWRALGVEPDGRPTVIAFSTPSCAACHTAQDPALQVVVRTLGPGAVRLIKIDLVEQPNAASTFGILTVPATVVLTAAGRVATANHGFASAERLIAQLHAADAPVGLP